jgi:hypothetical protein
MGLRIFSIGSLVADSISVATLAVNGIGTDSILTGAALVGAAALPPACYVAGKLLRRLDTPTAEVARQLAGFDINFI